MGTGTGTWLGGGPELSHRDARRLAMANLLMLALMGLHDLDHIRQALEWDYAIPLELVLVNFLVYIPNALGFVLVMRHDRRAAVVTPVAGVVVLVVFSVVHLMGGPPILGVWATPFPALHVDALTWSIFGLTLAGCLPALVLGPLVLHRKVDTRGLT